MHQALIQRGGDPRALAERRDGQPALLARDVDVLAELDERPPESGITYTFLYSAFFGTSLMARSAMAVMVRLGFTPRLAGMIEPSIT